MATWPTSRSSCAPTPSSPTTPVAELRQTSLLGEKFVVPQRARGRRQPEPLSPATSSPLDQTGRNPEVEEVLGALEPAAQRWRRRPAQDHRARAEPRPRGSRGLGPKSVLRQIEALMTQLDANKGDIVNAIESLNRLAIVGQRPDRQHRLRARGAAERPDVAGPAARRPGQDAQGAEPSRRRRRPGDPGVEGSRPSSRSAQLNPVLTELANSGDDFVNAFHVFLTYPFVDEVVGRDPQVARNLHMGDYTNLSIELDVTVDRRGRADAADQPAHRHRPGRDPRRRGACLQSGDLNSKACKRVLATPGRS